MIERAQLFEQIAHIEQLRQRENLQEDVAEFLKEIVDEVAEIEAVLLRLK